MELLKTPLLYNAIQSIISLIFIILLTFIFKKAIDIGISRMKGHITSEKMRAKSRTLISLVKNILDGVMLLLAILMILPQWGVNITPLLTGAGILGLAVSFGAQTLVKDIIAGFFIIMEDQYNVGDKIKIDTIEGEVLRITLRLTELIDKDGNRVFIPNSTITKVVRYKPSI
jgi:moderate conductance mechanosensitive channel